MKHVQNSVIFIFSLIKNLHVTDTFSKLIIELVLPLERCNKIWKSIAHAGSSHQCASDFDLSK